MAEKIRYTRKDLKGPDEFVSAFSRAVAWARENRLKLLSAAGGALLLVGGVFGAQAYYRWEESKASRDLWPHLSRVREYLQTPAGAYPEAFARLEQFLAAYLTRYPGTASAVYARYFLGSIAFHRGNYELSVAQFRSAIRENKAEEAVLPFLLRNGLAQALEAKGDFGAAAEAYREAAAGASGELRAQARTGEARTLALSGRKPESDALYRQVLTETADPRLKEWIEIRLAQAE